MRLKGLVTFKKRGDFLRMARSGIFFRSRSVCVQVHTLDKLQGAALSASVFDGNQSINQAKIRVGFTVSKKAGNAPQRNKIKRRFRDALQRVSHLLDVNCDYVLIGNKSSYEVPFSKLQSDLLYCLRGFLVNARNSRISNGQVGAEEHRLSAGESADNPNKSRRLLRRRSL